MEIEFPLALSHDRQGPNARAQAVYKAIVAYKRDHDGNSPSLRELMNLAGVSSTSMAERTLALLAYHGLIVVDPGSRSIRVAGGRWTLDSWQAP